MVTYVCNHSTQKADIGTSQVKVSLSYIVCHKPTLNKYQGPISKQTGKRKEKKQDYLAFIFKKCI